MEKRKYFLVFAALSFVLLYGCKSVDDESTLTAEGIPTKITLEGTKDVGVGTRTLLDPNNNSWSSNPFKFLWSTGDYVYVKDANTSNAYTKCNLGTTSETSMVTANTTVNLSTTPQIIVTYTKQTEAEIDANKGTFTTIPTAQTQTSATGDDKNNVGNYDLATAVATLKSGTTYAFTLKHQMCYVLFEPLYEEGTTKTLQSIKLTATGAALSGTATLNPLTFTSSPASLTLPTASTDNASVTVNCNNFEIPSSYANDERLKVYMITLPADAATKLTATYNYTVDGAMYVTTRDLKFTSMAAGQVYKVCHNLKTGQTRVQNAPGSIKHSYQTADHDGWYLLDGRDISTLSADAQTIAKSVFGSSATTIPDARDKYMLSVQGSSVGTVNAGSAMTATISQANLPTNATVSGITLSTSGNHNHANAWWLNWSFGECYYTSNSGTARLQFINNINTNTVSHSHTVTMAIGSSSPTAISTQPASVYLNTFVYLGE